MKKLMLGNEAAARGAYEAGCTVATAYPGTPSTEITETIAKYEEIYSEWSPNEKVALETAIGASIAGARAICVMKHVGLNVAADPLFTSSYTGVNGGLVIVVADDPGMHSSQNEQDSRHYARASKIPMLEPSDSSECKDFVILAFEISERFDTPVIVRLSTRISHSRSIVETNDRREVPLKEYKKDFRKYVMVPAMARKRHEVVEQRIKKIQSYSDETNINEFEWANRDTGIISSGIAYQYAREVFKNASFLKLSMVHPLPENMIREFCEKVKRIYVIEELDPFIEEQLKGMGIDVHGKDQLPLTGEYSAGLLRERFMDELPAEEQTADGSALPVRPPVMCPGCPHRGLFYVLKKLKLNVTGDIGCYTLGALPPLEAMDTCICMGAGVSVAHGMEKARGVDFGSKTVGVVGDSTFAHSGITGLVDIAYNRGNSTIIVLDNSITGMTGHQQNPMSGYNIKGDPAPCIDVEKLALSVGIKRVRNVDPFEIEELESIIAEETSADEPSLIVSRRPCALLKKVKYEGPLRIDTEKCINCGMCMRIGCPAISNRDGILHINETLCNGCMLCTRICRFQAIVKAGEEDV